MKQVAYIWIVIYDEQGKACDLQGGVLPVWPPGQVYAVPLPPENLCFAIRIFKVMRNRGSRLSVLRVP